MILEGCNETLHMVLLNSTGHRQEFSYSAGVSDNSCNIIPQKGLLEHPIFNSVKGMTLGPYLPLIVADHTHIHTH